MNTLEEQIKSSLLPGVYIPEEFSLLFKWIEDKNYYIDGQDGRIGFLYPDDESDDEERKGGTDITFFAEGNDNLHYWFGHEKLEVINQLCVFANTGGDGSMAAFWLDAEDNQQIVHLGSGSGSTLVCLLAKTPLDFLRLIAIGYDEICWSEQFDQTPNQSA